MRRWFARLREALVSPVVRELREHARSTHHELLALRRDIMAKLDDLNTLLDDIKAGLEAEAAKTTEIGADLDDLIALLQSGATDQALVDQAIAKATDIKAAVTAQSDTLSALAAKHDPSTT